MAEPHTPETLELLDKTRTVRSTQEDAAATDGLTTVSGLPAIFAEKYRVLEKIGEGGMSTVYKVQHILLNKIYALKVLHQIKEESILRFQQEAKASSLLEHPNIVRVHDFGIEDGLPYMTMDYIAGLPLGDFVKRTETPPLEKAAHIFGQICSALAHAHDRGIIHRDLKPSNIIVRRLEDGFEQAVVVDYGIAKILSEDSSPIAHHLTHTGDVFGTPLYMSPEQCQALAVDARSDIYSLGCVMYETITGKPPFQGGSVYEIIHKQITEAPLPFPDSVRRTKSGRLMEAAILRSMAKAPEDRQQHVLELSSSLKSIELGGGGLFSDLKAMTETISGRIKAAERRTVVLKFVLDACSVFSIFCSVLLLTLPGLIQMDNREIKRNNQIIRYVDAAFFKDEGWNDFQTAKAKTDRIIKSLNRLCKGESRQEHKCAEFSRSLDLAMENTKDLKRLLVARLAENLKQVVGFDSMQDALKAIIGVQTSLEEVVEQQFNRNLMFWISANKSGTDLIRISDENLENTKQRLQRYWFALVSSCLFAFPLLIILPLLTWQRFHSSRTSKLAIVGEQFSGSCRPCASHRPQRIEPPTFSELDLSDKK
jgi:tRNA A-37 threonylcarbamoyl transferase component Bud32